MYQDGVWAWAAVPWEPTSTGAQYQVIHLPSGTVASNVRTIAQAKGMCTALSSLPGLNTSTPSGPALSAAWAVVSNFFTGVTRRPKPKQPSAVNLTLRPLYRPGFTPSRRQRRLDQALAEELEAALRGDEAAEITPALAAATRAAWREEIMVRVVPGLMGERDVPVPKNGPPIEASPIVFKEHYQALLTIGDRLQLGAKKLQRLWVEAEAEGWTEQRVARWRDMDQRFRDLIYQGWWTWGLVAVIFDKLPEDYQARVTKKLGYIGNREAGWHELGIKTFLRHPEIKAVAPLRQEWNYREGRGEFD